MTEQAQIYDIVGIGIGPFNLGLAALLDPLPDVKALLQSELDRLSTSFKSYERPKNVLVVSEDFTVQNGLLTPSLKVKRRAVVAKYEKALAALY